MQHFPLRLIGTPYTNAYVIPQLPKLKVQSEQKGPLSHILRVKEVATTASFNLATVPVQISRTHHHHFLFSIVNSLPFSRHVALRVIRTLGVQQRHDRAIPLPAVSFQTHL